MGWGPKPFRVLNCWFMENSFKEMVEQSWNSFQVQGRASFVFKEKLKLVKKELKKVEQLKVCQLATTMFGASGKD